MSINFAGLNAPQRLNIRIAYIGIINYIFIRILRKINEYR
jgi:hypothetical protein